MILEEWTASRRCRLEWYRGNGSSWHCRAPGRAVGRVELPSGAGDERNRPDFGGAKPVRDSKCNKNNLESCRNSQTPAFGAYTYPMTITACRRVVSARKNVLKNAAYAKNRAVTAVGALSDATNAATGCVILTMIT